VEDDDGPGLMMACVEEVIKSTREQAVAPTAMPPELNSDTRTGGHVFLNEQRDIITPAHNDDHRSKVWFLGAMNHMSGSVDALLS
jgi:hypothetical protein